MSNPGWDRPESPFHAGELAIQKKLNVQEKMDRQGRRVIRDYLPEQFRQFFAQLPYVLVGTVDKFGRPWASILVGEPGFISTPDERSLRVLSKPLLGDPLSRTLVVGADIGFLGIELNTRRRNRINGVVSAVDDEGFEVQVRQSFGNCPQYIQSREYEWVDDGVTRLEGARGLDAFSDVEKKLIGNADTFYIATAYQAQSAGEASGVDVSHRGGKPGFVRIDGDRTLTIPDFSGNLHFNTFGNLELNPKAGLIFIDFHQGTLLYLTGTAKVIWDSPDIAQFEGAERLLRFEVERGDRVDNSLPFRWTDPEYSPFLKRTGSW